MPRPDAARRVQTRGPRCGPPRASRARRRRPRRRHGRTQRSGDRVWPDDEPAANPLRVGVSDHGRNRDGTVRTTSSATSSRLGIVARDTDSTKMSMMPPQVRPTAKASPSLTPNLPAVESRFAPPRSPVHRQCPPRSHPRPTHSLNRPEHHHRGPRRPRRRVEGRTTVPSPAVSPHARSTSARQARHAHLLN